MMVTPDYSHLLGQRWHFAGSIVGQRWLMTLAQSHFAYRPNVIANGW